MIFDQLKVQLLKQAIQGKLVPQLAEEGTGEQLGDVPEDVPFEIPKSWKWIGLSSIANVQGGKRLPAGYKLVVENTGHPYIRVSDMKDGGINMTSLLYLTEDCYKLIKKYTISSDDIYLTVAGTIGRVGIVPKELDGANLTENADKLVLKVDSIDRDWLLLVMKSSYCQRIFKAQKTQVGQPKLAIKRIESILIPVPPLGEQKRIIKKLDNLFSEIEKAEKAYFDLQQASEEFRKKVLQEAIQGKLIPQLAEDGVVKQLGEEPEEVPFEIPESWKWIQLKQLAVKISDGSHNPPPNTGSGIPVLSAKNVNNWDIDLSKIDRWTDLTNWSVENKKIPLEKGDVLLTIVGTIGRAAVVNFDEKFILQRSVCVIKQKRELINNRFLVFALSTPSIQQWLKDKASGTAQKGVYLKTVKEAFIPLPPLKAQERIVKKLDELLAQVASLKN